MFEHEDDLAIAMIVFMICGSVMAVFHIIAVGYLSRYVSAIA